METYKQYQKKYRQLTRKAKVISVNRPTGYSNQKSKTTWHITNSERYRQNSWLNHAKTCGQPSPSMFLEPVTKTELIKIIQKFKPKSLRWTTFLEKHNILIPTQHGFQNEKSTETSISSLTESVIDSLDKRNSAPAMFLDLSKAIDIIICTSLIEKLESYCIR
ncbi:uncharacterized protein LOC126355646 [Schistocerca gregaria]|uniref:uncharacterized protein LOC126355646 n=1 Tax=Schistocerca gregaria TaxID=7010 RepID=UPI00211F41C7|nr:uncharacterized protein LOC126355646 [Schistocerca gregaria]